MLVVLASGSVVTVMVTMSHTTITIHQHIMVTMLLSLLIVITIDLITATIVIQSIEVMVTGIMAMHNIPDKDIAHLIIIDVITTGQGTVETG